MLNSHDTLPVLDIRGFPTRSLKVPTNLMNLLSKTLQYLVSDVKPFAHKKPTPRLNGCIGRPNSLCSQPNNQILGYSAHFWRSPIIEKEIMKKNIHPNYRPIVIKDASAAGHFWLVSTAATNETTKWEDGQEYPCITVEMTSALIHFSLEKRKQLIQRVASRSLSVSMKKAGVKA